MTDSFTACASPCLLPFCNLDISFHTTNQCGIIFSAPILLPRPTSSSHVGASLTTLRWSVFAAKLGKAPATLLLLAPHTRAWLPISSNRSSWLASEASFSRPEGRPLSCPPLPAPQRSKCAIATTWRPSHGFRAKPLLQVLQLVSMSALRRSVSSMPDAVLVTICSYTHLPSNKPWPWWKVFLDTQNIHFHEKRERH